jgi:PHD/YefM family antitoxin component YafN of YafNO toxin-antitoxin module
VLEVPATKFVKNFGQYREQVQREAIAITSHGRTSGYFLSEHEYMEYLQLKANSRKAFNVSELPDETINALATAQMDASHDHLNRLMD